MYPTRDECHAPGGAGDQLSELFGVVSVVKHDQYPPIGQQTAEHETSVLPSGRNVIRPDAEGLQEAVKHVCRISGRAFRTCALEICEKLAVWEVVDQTMGGGRGEGCLSNARHPADYTDGDIM
ncbi:hypothetical protein ADL25_44920 [Streptomyces sp. NRRL F-5122]|nr:hypothetical protein ADL25_44920 [Streptomyces sp. NRRL F-5122]